jgi:hypothetical protein
MSITDVRNLSQLVEKSVFLSVRFGTLGNTRRVNAEKYDPAITRTADIAISTDADTSLLRTSKNLLESPQLDSIRTADTAMRLWLKATCLPYQESGMLIVPNALVEQVTLKLENYANIERPVLIAAFAEAYPQLLDEAKAKLGSLWKAEDYQPIDQVRSVFTFEYHYVTFAVPEFLKRTAFYDAEADKLKAKFESAATEITIVMRQALLDLVTNLSHQLAPAESEGKRKKLTTSALTKVQEFLNTFDARNITNDDELDAVVKQAKELIGTVEIDGLRKDGAFRETMAANMAGLQAQLAGLMVDDSPDRKVRI